VIGFSLLALLPAAPITGFSALVGPYGSVSIAAVTRAAAAAGPLTTVFTRLVHSSALDRALSVGVGADGLRLATAARGTGQIRFLPAAAQFIAPLFVPR